MRGPARLGSSSPRASRAAASACRAAWLAALGKFFRRSSRHLRGRRVGLARMWGPRMTLTARHTLSCPTRCEAAAFGSEATPAPVVQLEHET